MWRICACALFVSGLCLPALADPLSITPDAVSTVPWQSPPEQAAAPAPAAPTRVAAAQPNLGGGFIKSLSLAARRPLRRPLPSRQRQRCTNNGACQRSKFHLG